MGDVKRVMALDSSPLSLICFPYQISFEGKQMKNQTLIIGIIGILLLIQPLSAQTWEKTKRLTWNPNSSMRPSIAVDTNSNIHLLWSDTKPGNTEIYYKRSTNGGVDWTTKRLTWNSGNSDYPVTAVDSNNLIYALWRDNTPSNGDIFYRKSTNGGSSWTATKNITNNATYSGFPAIAIDSNNYVHIVWTELISGKLEVYYKRSTDEGSTWNINKRITWNSGDSGWPGIATDSSDKIHVVWSDDTPSNYEIFYKRSIDGGATWTGTKRLTYNSGESGRPICVTDSSDTVHILWDDDTPEMYFPEIFYKRSTDGGSTWQGTKRLTWAYGMSWEPSIAVDSNKNIHLVWRYETPSNVEIMYKQSKDSGISWDTSKRLTWNTGLSLSPAITVTATGTIHLVWYDDTPGNYEIYYKKGIQ
jgi:hypothetical protein